MRVCYTLKLIVGSGPIYSGIQRDSLHMWANFDHFDNLADDLSEKLVESRESIENLTIIKIER